MSDIDQHIIINSTDNTSPTISNDAVERDVTEVPIEIEQPKTNATLEFEVFAKKTDKDSGETVTLSIPADKLKNVEDVLNNIPNVAIGDTVGGARWVENIKASRYAVHYDSMFSSIFERDNSSFKQAIGSERGPLGISAPKFGDEVGTKLTGEAAVLRVRSLSGLGSVVQIPLWHSGFWVTLKAPSDGAMLELNRRIAEEKISVGRATYGLAFANNSVIYVGWVLDLIFSSIYDTSLKPELNDSIRSKISVLDIPLLVWGLACVIWPRGFPYARAVLNNAGEEQQVIREKINVSKCLWTDNSSLSPWQIGHMAGRNGRNMTAESLTRYKDEFTRGKNRSIVLNDQLEVVLSIPNIDQYLTSGQKWINAIVNMFDKAFSLPPNDDVRNDYIMDQGKATSMRQYSHWVESINAGGSIIDDSDTIEQTFDALSANDDFRDKYFKGIRNYIEDSTISIIGVPTIDDHDKTELPRFPHILPIDALSVFFILLVQKTIQVQNRM